MFKVGVFGDTHINSKKCDYSALEQTIKEFNSGVDVVFHLGDLIDGRRVYKGQDYELETLALNGINATGRSGGDWSNHAIEHSLSAIYDIAHGSGLAIIFPAWMRYVYKEDISKFARFASKVFGIDISDEEKAALAGIKHLKDWYKSLGLPVALSDANIPAEGIEKVVEKVKPSFGRPLGRLKKLNKEDVIEILRSCV